MEYVIVFILGAASTLIVQKVLKHLEEKKMKDQFDTRGTGTGGQPDPDKEEK